MSTSESFPDFLESLGLAARSCEVYRLAVTRCQVLAKEAGAPLVETAQTILRDPTLTGARRMTYRKALLKWATWAKDRELEAVLRATHVKGEKQRKSRPYALAQDEYFRFLEIVDEEVDDPVEWGAIILIATTGMRVGDVLGLDQAGLVEALKGSVVQVAQKGGKRRDLSLSSESQQQAAQALISALRRPQERVWRAQGLRLNASSPAAVSERLRRRIAALGKAAGLDVHVTPQVLRKSLGDLIYEESGHDMRLVAQALGHDNVRTTENHYQNHGRPEKLREIMGKIQRGK